MGSGGLSGSAGDDHQLYFLGLMRAIINSSLIYVLIYQCIIGHGPRVFTPLYVPR